MFEARKARGECYRCGDKYFIGHQGKDKQLNTLQGTTEQEEILENTTGEIIEVPPEIQDGILDEAISLNSLSGTVTSNIIKLKGVYGKQGLVILADSGSTHSFIASRTAKQLGCVVNGDLPMRVTAANVSHLMSYYSCPYFKWKI